MIESLSYFIDGGLLLKVTFILLVVLTVALLLGRQDPRWQVNLSRIGMVAIPVVLVAHGGWPEISIAQRDLPVLLQPVFGDAERAAPTVLGGLDLGFILLVIWGAGVVLAFIREFVGFISVLYQGNHAGVARNELQKCWDEVARQFGVQNATLRVMQTEQSPFITFSSGGVIVVIPESFQNELSERRGKVAHALRHEAAHLRSRDHVWMPLMRLATSLLWYHPVVWWLSTLHLRACEESCDAEAARIGGLESYQQALATFALELVPVNQAVATSFIRLPSVLKRIERLKETVVMRPPQWMFLLPTVGLMMMGTVCFGLIQVTPQQLKVVEAQSLPERAEALEEEASTPEFKILGAQDVRVEVQIKPTFLSNAEVSPEQRRLLTEQVQAQTQEMDLKSLGIDQEMLMKLAQEKVKERIKQLNEQRAQQSSDPKQ